MSERDNPAFPTQIDFADSQGLTKREMFAAMAMQGLLSGVDEPNVFGCAKYAVLLADALLAEREKPAESEASR